MYFIGADPGRQGAICSLNSEYNTVTFYPNPDPLRIYYSMAMSGNLPHWETVSGVAIEDVHSIGGMSAKSNFQFGRNLGLLEAVLHNKYSDIVYVQPKVWQKICDIKFIYPKGATPLEKKKIRKETTATRVLQLYPDAPIYGARGGLKDGRADALMIAHYLRITKGGYNASTTSTAKAV